MEPSVISIPRGCAVETHRDYEPLRQTLERTCTHLKRGWLARCPGKFVTMIGVSKCRSFDSFGPNWAKLRSG